MFCRAYALYTLPTTDTLYVHINCAYYHASDCNGIICSTHSSLQLRSCDGGLRTLCRYQFLSLSLQFLMHVLLSSSVVAPNNVHMFVANTKWFTYHAQPENVEMVNFVR